MTLREAAAWIGVTREDDLELFMAIPTFRRAVGFVSRGYHLRIWGEPRPRHVWERFDLPTNRNGDLNLEWLRDLGLKCRREG